MTETRKETEERLRMEWDAYVAACKANGERWVDYMNWAYSQKMKSKDSL